MGACRSTPVANRGAHSLHSTQHSAREEGGIYGRTRRAAAVAVDPGRRLPAAGGADRGGGGGGGRRDPLRRDGRLFRAEPEHRPAGAGGGAPGDAPADRRPSDDRAAGTLLGRVCRGGGRLADGPRRGRDALAPDADAHPRAGRAGGRDAQPRHARRRARRDLAARRSGAGDDGQSGVRRAAVHRGAARQDRPVARGARRGRLRRGPLGRWRGRAGQRRAGGGGGGGCDRRRLGGLQRSAAGRGGDRGAAARDGGGAGGRGAGGRGTGGR